MQIAVNWSLSRLTRVGLIGTVTVLGSGGLLCSAPALAQEMINPKHPRPVVQEQVAPDLYFLFDYDSSNSGFLVTDEGVLVVDTRQHSRGLPVWVFPSPQ